jgi:hypothetical protein
VLVDVQDHYLPIVIRKQASYPRQKAVLASVLVRPFSLAIFLYWKCAAQLSKLGIGFNTDTDTDLDSYICTIITTK